MIQPKSKKIRLSVAIATFNEERCLTDCLESVKDLADEIVIVDGSSTDFTVEIAKRYGAKVTVTSNPPIFHINKQKAIDQCEGEWILQLDADETITPELAEEIRSVVSDKQNTDYKLQTTDYQFVAYWIKRRKMFLGHWIKKGGHYPDPVIRLFRKGKAHLPCKSVHEQMEVDGRVGWLNNEMVHIPTPTFASYITKDNRYSTLMAKEMVSQNIPCNWVSFIKYFVWIPIKTVFSLFIRHRGYKDGFPGFVFALYSGLGQTSAYIKYWELKNSKEDSARDWV